MALAVTGLVGAPANAGVNSGNCSYTSSKGTSQPAKYTLYGITCSGTAKITPLVYYFTSSTGGTTYGPTAGTPTDNGTAAASTGVTATWFSYGSSQTGG
jgi:hypothetical protein